MNLRAGRAGVAERVIKGVAYQLIGSFSWRKKEDEKSIKAFAPFPFSFFFPPLLCSSLVISYQFGWRRWKRNVHPCYRISCAGTADKSSDGRRVEDNEDFFFSKRTKKSNYFIAFRESPDRSFARFFKALKSLSAARASATAARL